MRSPTTFELSRPCRLWTGAVANGYGHRMIAGRTMSAHRVEFIIAVGDPGPELKIDHKCNTRLCIEITHLQAITNAENTQRAWGTCKQGHAWTEENILRWAAGRRRCRTCENDRVAARRKAA